MQILRKCLCAAGRRGMEWDSTKQEEWLRVQRLRHGFYLEAWSMFKFIIWESEVFYCHFRFSPLILLCCFVVCFCKAEEPFSACRCSVCATSRALNFAWCGFLKGLGLMASRSKQTCEDQFSSQYSASLDAHHLSPPCSRKVSHALVGSLTSHTLKGCCQSCRQK